jgi:ribosomal protein L11 methyltransferase
VRVAASNAALNGVGHLVKPKDAPGMRHGEIRRLAPYDLIVANILAEPLMRLAPQMAPLVAPGGKLVLSGLLPRQRERVVAAFGAQGIRLRSARTFSGWAVLVLQRP